MNMKSVKAECFRREKSFYNGNLAEFRFTIDESFGELFFKYSNVTLEIITQIDELELKWVILGTLVCDSDENSPMENYGGYHPDYHYSWHDISLERSDCDYIVSGKFNFEDVVGEFDSACLPYKKKLNIDYTLDPSEITFIINYDKKIKSSSELSSIIENYHQFLEKKELSDLTFVVEDKEIPAHKVIVSAQSSVFEKMIEWEKNSSLVKIEGIRFETFQLLLRFIYCETLECDDVYELLDLLVAADKYSVIRLVELARIKISDNLQVDNVIDVLIIADLVKTEYLKYQCLKLVQRKKYEVIKTKGYKNMVESGRVELLSQLFCL